MDIGRTKKLVAFDEGFRPSLYKCPRGFSTIGYGFNLDRNDIPKEVADFWLEYNLKKLNEELDLYLPFYKKLNDARKYVLINMAYQMGLHGLLGFREFLENLKNGHYKEASESMKDSRWYRDFTNRANRLVNIMIKGEF